MSPNAARILRHNAIPLLSGLIFAAMFALYLALQPRGVQVGVLVTAAFLVLAQRRGHLVSRSRAARNDPALTFAS